ncbi:MAG: hypothetical protein IPI62_16125 [Bacteroidetes bacterium]|nr:hypothetical protein [Bacteroidota bacterium]
MLRLTFLGKNYPELVDALDQIVNNTNIDFNLFDSEGGLMYSSQPKIYDQNIVSQRMNPKHCLDQERPTY